MTREPARWGDLVRTDAIGLVVDAWPGFVVVAYPVWDEDDDVDLGMIERTYRDRDVEILKRGCCGAEPGGS